MFDYVVNDNVYPGNVSATVTITVAPPDQLTAVNDTYQGKLNTPFTPLGGNGTLVNDFSPNPTPNLEVIWVGEPTPGIGTVTSWSLNGSFTFVPTAKWSGTSKAWWARVMHAAHCCIRSACVRQYLPLSAAI